MKAGKLRQRLVIQRATETQDTHGEPDATWSTHASVWGSVEPLYGTELYRAQEVHPSVSHEVRIRYLSTLTPKDRILFGARVLNIEAIIDREEKHAEMLLLCSEWKS